MRGGIDRRLAAGLVIILLLCAHLARPQKRQEFYRYPRAMLDQHRAPKDAPPANSFTFCRVMFTSKQTWSGGPWWTDFPDAELNFSERVAELTTLQTNPPVCVKLTEPELFHYPLIYMLEVGTLEFEPEEIAPLRTYLLSGGFLLVDDFWGEDEWANWELEITRVFPPEEYPIRTIPLDHEIFHCVFDVKEVPQVPAIGIWEATGLSYERYDAKEAHCRGIFDKQGRLMVLIMHNTDLGDGWEREGENEEYFREFSAKKAFPMGINIVVYAMTH